MSEKIYYTSSSILFSVIAIVHLVRIVHEWEAVVSGAVIPMWVSWVAVLIAGYLAVRGFSFIHTKERSEMNMQ